MRSCIISCNICLIFEAMVGELKEQKIIYFCQFFALIAKVVIFCILFFKYVYLGQYSIMLLLQAEHASRTSLNLFASWTSI